MDLELLQGYWHGDVGFAGSSHGRLHGLGPPILVHPWMTPEDQISSPNYPPMKHRKFGLIAWHVSPIR